MKVKATFNGGFTYTNSIKLVNVISIDNEKQTQEFFESFVTLVNSPKIKARIKKLTIVDTTYLNRHYDPSYGNYEEKETPWRKENADLLEKIACNYEVISWKFLLVQEEYKKYHSNLMDDYKNDKVFTNIVNTLAGSYLHKGKREDTITYLLEECAGTLVLNGYLTYPGKLNAALRHVIAKYKPQELRFQRYKCRSKEPSTQQIICPTSPILPYGGYSPSFFGISLAYYAENSGVPQEKQHLFTMGFLQYIDWFKTNNPTSKINFLSMINYEEKENESQKTNQSTASLPRFN